MTTTVKFEDLQSSNLMLDCIYESGTATNLAADVLSKLVPGCQNMGGFRKARGRKSRRLAYVVLVPSLSAKN